MVIQDGTHGMAWWAMSCARVCLLAAGVAVVTAGTDVSAFGQRQGVSRPLPDVGSVEEQYWKRAQAAAMRDEEGETDAGAGPGDGTATAAASRERFEYNPQRALAMAVKAGVRSEGEHLRLGSRQLLAMQEQLMTLVGAFHRFCSGTTPPVRYTAFRGTLAGALFYDALIRKSSKRAPRLDLINRTHTNPQPSTPPCLRVAHDMCCTAQLGMTMLTLCFTLMTGSAQSSDCGPLTMTAGCRCAR